MSKVESGPLPKVEPESLIIFKDGRLVVTPELEEALMRRGVITDIKDYRIKPNPKDTGTGVSDKLYATWEPSEKIKKGIPVLIKFADIEPDPEKRKGMLLDFKRMVINEFIVASLYNIFLYPKYTPPINLINRYTEYNVEEKGEKKTIVEQEEKFAIASIFFDFQNLVEYQRSGQKSEEKLLKNLKGLAKLVAVSYALMGDEDISKYNAGVTEDRLSNVDRGLALTSSFDSKNLDEEVLELRDSIRLNFLLKGYLKSMPRGGETKEQDRMILNVNELREAVAEVNNQLREVVRPANEENFDVIKEVIGRACEQLKSIGLGNEHVSDLNREYGPFIQEDLPVSLQVSQEPSSSKHLNISSTNVSDAKFLDEYLSFITNHHDDSSPSPSQTSFKGHPPLGINWMDLKNNAVVKYLKHRHVLMQKLEKDLDIIAKITLKGASEQEQKDFLDYKWIHLLGKQDPVKWAHENDHLIDRKEASKWAQDNKYPLDTSSTSSMQLSPSPTPTPTNKVAGFGFSVGSDDIYHHHLSIE